MPLYSQAVDGLEDDAMFGGVADGGDHGLEIVNALRQTGDSAEAVHEEALRKLLASLDEIATGAAPEGSVAESYLRCSTEWTELFDLWSLYHTRRGSAALANSVLVVARLIEACTSARDPSGALCNPPSDPTGVTRVQAPLTSFAPSAVAVCRAIVQRQLRAVYPWLGSDDGRLIKSSMRLVAAIAWCSPGLARELQTSFNWGLKGFQRTANRTKVKQGEPLSVELCTRSYHVLFVTALLATAEPRVIKELAQSRCFRLNYSVMIE